MRTAVIRVNVDQHAVLTRPQLREGMATLRGLTRDIGAEVVQTELASRPPHRREVELLIAGDDVESTTASVIGLCRQVFGTEPVAGVVTFVSRGTDDDARGVLSAFGIAGAIAREAGDDGYDVVYVTLRETDLDRVPESRIHSALEASLNCEVHIRTH